MPKCLNCRREFEPRKRGHVFCTPECRHRGVRKPDAPQTDWEAVERLFDEDRDASERVTEDDWHPGPPEWAELDAGDTLSTRRNWCLELLDAGRL
jgi:DNA-directed RNA polymerase subunit RPC12/RpoP